MAIVRVETTIAAPIGRCFDLARDIDFHVRSLAATGERAIAGRVTGLIGPEESVAWQARHLGVTRRFTARVTRYDRPVHFRDDMTEGAFRSFVHDDRFETRGDVTLMIDIINFRSPLGSLGRLVDLCFMRGYLRRLLAARCRAIKAEAESK
jgi:ligand-binding SRPBCC domain-containing protein